jgi:hypothetical protein
MWGVAGLLFLGFAGLRLQRAMYNLLLDREGASKELIRRD